MTVRAYEAPLDPQRDLVLDRWVDVPPELVWKVWTQPEHLMPWFCPKPWITIDAELDPRPGGIFRTTMRSTEGQEFPSTGCYLDVVENQRITFTDALGPGFRPMTGGLGFTGILTFTPERGGTRYVVKALHRDEPGRKQHEEMGFHNGWSAALDQLVAYVKSMKG